MCMWAAVVVYKNFHRGLIFVNFGPTKTPKFIVHMCIAILP